MAQRRVVTDLAGVTLMKASSSNRAGLFFDWSAFLLSLLNSRRSRRLKIAQHFSAGINAEQSLKSVQRTTDRRSDFSRPLHGLLTHSLTCPTAEAVGYFHFVRFTDE